MKPNWRPWMLDIGKIAVALLALLFILRMVSDNWVAIRPLLPAVDIPLLLAAFLAQATAFLLFPVASLMVLRTWKKDFGYLANAQIYFLSQLTKYLPGSVWIFPTRVYLMNKAGFSPATASIALIFETLAFVATGLGASLVALSTFPAAFRSWGTVMWSISLFIIIILCLIIFAPRDLRTWLPARFWPVDFIPKTKASDPAERSGRILLTLGSLLAGWLVSGMSVYLLMQAVHAPTAGLSIWSVVSAFSFAWVCGYAILVSPGGVGVREAVLLAIISLWIPAPFPVLVAVLSRIGWSVCELVLYSFSALAIKQKTGEPESVPNPK